MRSSATPPLPPLAAAVAARFADLPGVAAVALGGSTAGGAADGGSDLDLYVYARETPPLPVRAAIARAFGRPAQVGLTFFEPGDEWPATADQPAVDLMYRTPAWIEDQLHRTLTRHEAAVGCSTCLWANVRGSRPLFDRDGWYARLQRFAARPYPEGLRRVIVAKNHPLLRATAFSYLHQLEAAVRRGDAVGVQHRSTALLASYFDVLFAANRVPHPGEKRLLERTRRLCGRVPPAFEEDVTAFLRAAGTVPPGADVLAAAHALVDGLDGLLAALGLTPRSGPGS
jgi:Nucleotidyltransferase domain